MDDELREAFVELHQAVRKVINLFREAILQGWEHVQEQCGELVEEYFSDKPKWHVPYKLTSKSQVINRKPTMPKARSNC